MTKLCKIHECSNPSKSRGLCGKHYERLRRHQDTGVNFNAFSLYRAKLARDNVIPIRCLATHPDEHRVLRSVFDEEVAEDWDGINYLTKPIGMGEIYLMGEES